MLLISIIMHPAIILKIFRPFFIAIQYLYSLKFSIWFPSQLSICISVCFKNGQSQLELPTHLSLQNPTALPLPCFALLDFVVVTSGENKYSLCSYLFSCWCSKLCDFFLLALNFASIDVNRCFLVFYHMMYVPSIYYESPERQPWMSHACMNEFMDSGQAKLYE